MSSLEFRERGDSQHINEFPIQIKTEQQTIVTGVSVYNVRKWRVLTAEQCLVFIIATKKYNEISEISWKKNNKHVKKNTFYKSYKCILNFDDKVPNGDTPKLLNSFGILSVSSEVQNTFTT